MYSILGDSININKTCRMYESMEMYTVKIDKKNCSKGDAIKLLGALTQFMPSSLSWPVISRH